MANVTNQKKVLILDTAADNIVPAGVKVKVRAIKFIPIAAGQCTISDAGNAQAKIEGSGAQNVSDWQDFNPPFELNGLRLIAITATCRVYVYCE